MVAKKAKKALAKAEAEAVKGKAAKATKAKAKVMKGTALKYMSETYKMFLFFMEHRRRLKTAMQPKTAEAVKGKGKGEAMKAKTAEAVKAMGKGKGKGPKGKVFKEDKFIKALREMRC